jgi:hypothetical protein
MKNTGLITNVSTERNAGKLFESSKTPLKNRLLRIVLSNLEFDDKILFYKRRAPFDVISECLQTSNWLGLQVTEQSQGWGQKSSKY